MYDVVTIGDVTIDLFFKGKELTQEENRFHLAIGGKYEADTFYESLGGGGANVAVGISHHGFNTALLGRVGDNPFKQMIIQKLLKAHVANHLLIDVHDYFNISSILLADNGDKTVIHYVASANKFQLSEKLLENAAQTRWIYIGNLPDMPLADKIAVVAFFKKNKLPICLNIGRHDLDHSLSELKKLFGFVDIFYLNTHEFSQLINKKYETIDFAKPQQQFIPGFKGKLLITDGRKGSYCYADNEVIFQPIVEQSDPVDCTGAGDGYISGFLSAYITNSNVRQAMLSGSIYAAKIVAKVGAQ